VREYRCHAKTARNDSKMASNCAMYIVPAQPRTTYITPEAAVPKVEVGYILPKADITCLAAWSVDTTPHLISGTNYPSDLRTD
jgi:hypothetical protein